MTRKAPHELLAVLRESLAGRQKLVAHETWPGAPDAESRMSRVLSGELGIPARLFELAVAGPGGEVIAAYVDAKRRGNPADLRERALAKLERVEAQLELAFSELREADDLEARLERARVVKVEPRRPRARASNGD